MSSIDFDHDDNKRRPLTEPLLWEFCHSHVADPALRGSYYDDRGDSVEMSAGHGILWGAMGWVAIEEVLRRNGGQIGLEYRVSWGPIDNNDEIYPDSVILRNGRVVGNGDPRDALELVDYVLDNSTFDTTAQVRGTIAHTLLGLSLQRPEFY